MHLPRALRLCHLVTARALISPRLAMALVSSLAIPSGNLAFGQGGAQPALSQNAGFAAHVNFSDPAKLIGLSQQGRFLVHGLAAENGPVSSARAAIREANLEGAVSVESGSLTRLPYSDHLVNLLVVEDLPSLTKGGLGLDEVLRVVAPDGDLWLGLGRQAAQKQALSDALARLGVNDIEWVERDGTWAKLIKPRPEVMGTWSHRRHDAAATAVSTESKLDVPNGVRWVAGPNWATHLRYSAVQGVTASRKQLVYYFDDEQPENPDPVPAVKLEPSPAGKPRQFSLVGRDAFNGLMLWKRWLAGTPNSSLLITLDDRVFTSMDADGSLVALDPRTGVTLMTYKEVRQPPAAAFAEGRLLVLDRSGEVVCLDPDSGRVQWRHKSSSASDLIAGDGKVFFVTKARLPDGNSDYPIVCLDLASGREQWQAPTRKWTGGSAPKLILYRDGDLVLSTSKGTHGASAEDGSHRWTYKYERIGHGGSYSKVLHFDGLVWVHPAESDGKKQYAWEGLDPKTGEVRKRFLQPADFSMKHRCFEDRASARQILCGTMDFVDIKNGAYEHFAGARHSCRDGGVLPANGQLYTFPHSCHCYPMLRGFLGLVTKAEPVAEPAEVERGPAFGMAAGAARAAGGWPTHRGSSERSSSTTDPGPTRLETLWMKAIDGASGSPLRGEWQYKEAGTLSSPVISGDMVIAAAIDAHRVEALDARTGQPRWSFTADGRVDVPPTVHNDLCLFGSRDGRVYCVRASDGELVWRQRVAPRDERIVVCGQLESTWPVVGGVLVHQGVAYAAAGRHSHADGGIHVTAFDPAEGKVLWRSQPNGFMGLADLLLARDQAVNMIHWQFDARSGANRADESEGEFLRAGRLGLLNDSWYTRPIALRKSGQRWKLGDATGQMLVYDSARVCGFDAGDDDQPTAFGKGTEMLQGKARVWGKRTGDRRNKIEWTIEFPQGSQVRGMALAGDRLYLAGRLQGVGSDTHELLVVSTKDGSRGASMTLPSEPVHEGVAVAAGRAYVTLQDGSVLCVGDK